MTKEELVQKINVLLRSEMDLDFLMVLEKEELETLVAYIRDRLHQPNGQT
jgi:hypothetical protein